MNILFDFSERKRLTAIAATACQARRGDRRRRDLPG
jgi:hypothetical protein